MRNCRPRLDAQGFTLMEIMISVLVLGTSLVVMISLQSAIVDRTMRDQRRLQAMLAARSIFSALESDPAQLKTGEQSGTLAEVVSSIPALEAIDDWREPAFDIFRARYAIDEWELPIPSLDPDNPAPNATVFRAQIEISWSDSPLDSLRMYYFLPPPPTI